jgi:hypothetical protein
MARNKEQDCRWIIVVRYGERNTFLILHAPLRFPIFTKRKKATEFLGAFKQVMRKPLPIKLTKLMVSERKWPWRGMNHNYIDPKPALFDPPISEASRAALMVLGEGIILLARP